MAQKSPRILGLIAIVLIASVGTGGVLLLSKKSTTAQTDSTTATTTATTTPTATTSSTTSTYKDGTYSATGSYDSPGGTEKIGVTVTLKDGIVTASSVKTMSDGVSAEYQSQFAGGYKQYVVGKAIASISLSRVSGSSLTSTGFNNALKSIEIKAQA